MKLTAEQSAVVKFFLNEGKGASVLLTGPAGTGKSEIIRAIYQWLNEQGKDANLAMLGSTGTAATAMGHGAITLHSFTRISVSDESLEEYAARLKRNPHVLKKMKKIKFLVLDEISMTQGDTLMKLDLALRIAHQKHDTCFGGIAVMLVGDFFQLPPVFSRTSKGESDWTANLFAFEVFNVIGFYPKVFRLRRVMRQDDEADADFVRALSEARLGIISYQSMEIFQQCANTRFPKDGVIPTVVVLTNREAEEENVRHLFDSEAEMVTFRPYWMLADRLSDVASQNRKLFKSTATATSNVREHVKAKYLKCDPLLSLPLRLRTGAQVMFRRNLSPENGISNGARGVVVGWVDCDSSTVTKCLLSYDDGPCSPTPTGMLMPVPVVYVATTGKRYVVNIFGGVAGTVVTDNQISRHVIVFFMPLSLAYAITAHKAQGLTIDRMIFNIKPNTPIPPSLMYVVFSRAKGSKSIKITGTVTKKMFWVHPRLSGAALGLLEQQGDTSVDWPTIPKAAKAFSDILETLQ